MNASKPCDASGHLTRVAFTIPQRRIPPSQATLAHRMGEGLGVRAIRDQWFCHPTPLLHRSTSSLSESVGWPWLRRLATLFLYLPSAKFFQP